MLSTGAASETLLLSNRSKQILRKSALPILIAVLLSASGCGKRTPPIPPKAKVNQRVELTGFQRGNQVILSWNMPARNAAKNSVTNISRADIYRLTEPLTAPLQLSEEEFSNRSTLIAALALTDADFGLKTINYKDELEFAGQAARIRYAIRFVNSSGQKAAFSNTFLIEPTSKIASSPSDLVAKASQESISLRWHAPTTNVDGSSPASILGYNVYRSISAKEPAKLLNQTPVKATEFNDEFFEFEKDYFYFVRAVSLGTGAAPVESAESNIVKFKAVDVFPPSAPGSITLAAAPGVISIFFAVNPEKDVIGYKIYRSEDPDIPKEQWKLLTPELSKTNTYQDLRLPSGKVIYYYITAVDKFGNVSQPSEVVSERVP